MKIDISTLKKVEDEFGQFEIGRIWGGGNHNYLRFGYWQPVIGFEKLQEIMDQKVTMEVETIKIMKKV